MTARRERERRKRRRNDLCVARSANVIVKQCYKETKEKEELFSLQGSVGDL